MEAVAFSEEHMRNFHAVKKRSGVYSMIRFEAPCKDTADELSGEDSGLQIQRFKAFPTQEALEEGLP